MGAINIETNFEDKYNKYKNDTTAQGRLRFAILFNIPDSPYYAPSKYKELIEDLSKTEPIGHYHSFIYKIIMKEYAEAFEYFKLWEPYLLGHGEKYRPNKELQEFVFLTDWKLYLCLRKEIYYLGSKTRDLYKQCTQCTETSYRYCTHYQLNRYDIVSLNILRMSNATYECPICYESVPYARGGTCFDRNKAICSMCVLSYERGEFENRQKCTECRNAWCKKCGAHIKKCPFCRINLQI